MDAWRQVRTASSGASSASHDADASGQDTRTNLVGLALSGGGIRSATFCLGLLQGLHTRGILKCVDYLSTVSGGGFCGGWWTAWLTRPTQNAGDIFPGPEEIAPAREQRERETWGAVARSGRAVSNAASSAGIDPVHHLRLFANYLTPRKGILSADTWRATAVVSRNLALTWLVLLPVLGALVLAGQAYFLARSDGDLLLRCAPFAESPIAGPSRPTPGAATPPTVAPTAISAALAPQAALSLPSLVAGHTPQPAAAPVTNPKTSSCEGSGKRRAVAEAIRPPLLTFLCWIVVLSGLWMLYGYDIGPVVLRCWSSLGCLACLFVLYAYIVRPIGTRSSVSSLHAAWLLVTCVGVLGLILAFGFTNTGPASRDSRSRTLRDVQRNHIVALHGTVLPVAVLGVAFLALCGFAPGLVDDLLRPTGQLSIPQNVARLGGWTAIVSAIAGAGLTAWRAAPTSAEDGTKGSTSSSGGTVWLSLVPSATLIVLSILLAAGTARLIDMAQAAPTRHTLHLLVLASALAYVVVAAHEVLTEASSTARPTQQRTVLWVCLGAGALAGGFAAYLITVSIGQQLDTPLFALLVGITGFLAFRALLVSDARTNNNEPPWRQLRIRWTAADHPARTRGVLQWAGGLLAFYIAAVMLLAWFRVVPAVVWQAEPIWIATAAVFLLPLCAVFILAEAVWWRGDNWRALLLASAACIMLSVLLLLLYAESRHDWQARLPGLQRVDTALALLSVALAVVVVAGWFADPNLIGLHAFYRARLVRAYLGASNGQRQHVPSAEITDTVAGDDLCLDSVNSGPAIGPYHLINTTLNLVGGHDLATAQRSSAMFVLSRRRCGSTGTGFRQTEQYMGGELTLGTAVAISGAAVSPTMGAKTPSAALAMLLALFNVRLGFWAPTPGGTRWKSVRPRLWPFYLLREFISQTNDLGSYCYLTDGGHFDNTAVYSLIERGCRYIILADCGADPRPCFSDIGDLIRRCRIDFGTEITLDVTPFPLRPAPATAHAVRGTVVYSEEHTRRLGWRDRSDGARTGTLIWLKPSLTERLPAELRQYGLENAAFPQQSTSNQWFDEAQFESYRRLGECSALSVFARQGELP